MAKTKRRDAAARGTKLDPEREVKARPAQGMSRKEAKLAEKRAARKAARRARGLDAYEQRNAQIFTVVEVVLVLVPIAMIAYVWLVSGGSLSTLQAALQGDPMVTIAFISAVVQPVVAWQLRFVAKRYRAGDGGFTAANLIGFVCGELLLQNPVGIVGCGLLLWRVWRKLDGQLSEWAEERQATGMLLDVIGAVLIIVVGALCAFSTWRVMMAG